MLAIAASSGLRPNVPARGAATRHLQPSGTCAACVRAAAPRKPPKRITCVCCGEQRRNAGHGLCNRCTLADPDRPFRYAASMAARMPAVPSWWDELVAFAAARSPPEWRGVDSAPDRADGDRGTWPSPQQILSRRTPGAAPRRAGAGALAAFFTSRGLALPDDQAQHRAAARRQRTLTLSRPHCARRSSRSTGHKT